MDALDWHGIAMRPLAGGFSGETFVVGSGEDPIVVRIYRRDPGRAEVDASLLRLVRGLVPVPEVLELRRAGGSEPALLATRYVPGVRLEDALTDGHLDFEAVGASLAAVLNALNGIPFLRFGMFEGADLAVAPPEDVTDLREWAEQLQPHGRLSTWHPADWTALLALLNGASDLIEEHAQSDPERQVLVHSDFNPKNILVDPLTWEVVALLDWEFAHAGSPYTDLGNFCRFERDARLVEPLLAHLSRPPAGRPGTASEAGQSPRPVGAGRAGGSSGDRPGTRPRHRPAARAGPQRRSERLAVQRRPSRAASSRRRLSVVLCLVKHRAAAGPRFAPRSVQPVSLALRFRPACPQTEQAMLVNLSTRPRRKPGSLGGPRSRPLARTRQHHSANGVPHPYDEQHRGLISTPGCGQRHRVG